MRNSRFRYDISGLLLYWLFEGITIKGKNLKSIIMGKQLLNKTQKVAHNFITLLSEFGKAAGYALSH